MSAAVTQHQLSFHPLKPVVVDFDAPQLTSDGGFLLTRLIDDQQQLCTQIAALLPDDRREKSITHTRLEQTRQRVFGLVQGYVDCNDALKLNSDPLLKCALDALPTQNQALSSQPTLCRFEHCITSESLEALRSLLEHRFVDDLPAKTRQVVLDLDGTWDPAHGEQQLALFNAHYDGTGFLPLLIFDDEGRLASLLLRAGNVPDSTRGLELLTRIITRLRARFPTVRVIVRGDAAFSMPDIMEGLEKLSTRQSLIFYLFGIKSNSRLNQLIAQTVLNATSWLKGQRRFHSFEYAAHSWPHKRRIVARVLATEQGPKVRFVVTNLCKQARRLYVADYCQRGQAENYIKDFKRGTTADRLSCQRFEVNEFRLLLHGFAYVLLYKLRSMAGLLDRSIKTVTMQTLRATLLKVAACVRTSARRIHIQFPESYSHKALFSSLLKVLTKAP